MVRNLRQISATFICAFVFASSSYAQQPPSPQEPPDVKSVSQSTRKLEDFSRLAQAIGERILLIDPDGQVREGVLADMTADSVTMRFGSVTQSFKRAEIASADRFKDPTSDGVAKGMLFAAICGFGAETLGQYLGGIAAWGVIGYLIDAGQSHREPLYRAAGVSSQTTGLASARSVAFRIRF